MARRLTETAVPGGTAAEDRGWPGAARLRSWDTHPVLDDSVLGDWCRQFLGSRPARVLFRTGHLSQVIAAELGDGRQVVIKARPPGLRIAGCVAVQAHLARAGFPCPDPLTGPEQAGGLTVTAETLIPGGSQLPPEHGAAPFAGCPRHRRGPGGTIPGHGCGPTVTTTAATSTTFPDPRGSTPPPAASGSGWPHPGPCRASGTATGNPRTFAGGAPGRWPSTTGTASSPSPSG